MGKTQPSCEGSFLLERRFHRPTGTILDQVFGRAGGQGGGPDLGFAASAALSLPDVLF
jgi:hypothetical protein